MLTPNRYILFLVSILALSCSKSTSEVNNKEIMFSATNVTASVVDLKNTQNSQNTNGAYLFEDSASFKDKTSNGGYFNVEAYKSGYNFAHFNIPTTVFYHDDTNTPGWFIYNPDTKEIEQRYWPVDYALDFFAYMPLMRPLSGQNLITQTVDPATHITGFGYDEQYKCPTFICEDLPLDKEGQNNAKEFIYAWTFSQSPKLVENTGGKVPLIFNHAMAAISIEIGGAHAGTKIEELGFNNIYNNGTFTVATRTWSLWKKEGKNDLENLSIKPTNHIIPDTIQIGYTYGPYLVLPQEFGETVEIAVKFTWRSPENVTKKLKDVLKNQPLKWESGKKYIYSIILGDSSEDIMINVRVEQWGVGGSQEIEIK